jgi:hypothetical protein
MNNDTILVSSKEIVEDLETAFDLGKDVSAEESCNLPNEAYILKREREFQRILQKYKLVKPL